MTSVGAVRQRSRPFHPFFGRPDPWFAVALNWMLPGLGQLNAGRYGLGAGLVLTWMLLEHREWSAIRDLYLGSFSIVSWGIAAVVLKIVACLHVYRELARRSPPLQGVNPYKALAIGFIIPFFGGYVYLRRVLLSVGGIAVFLSSDWIGRHVLPGSWILWGVVFQLIGDGAGIHAYWIARGMLRRRTARVIQPPATWGLVVLAWLGLTLAGTWWWRADVGPLEALKSARMKSDSMAPTLAAGEIVTYLPTDVIRRGDVVVYEVEGRRIRRVAGVPGDVVALSGGRVMVNGAPDADHGTHPETQLESAGWRPFGPVTLGSDEYLLLPDHPALRLSLDEWAIVSREAITGKVGYVIWPLRAQRSVH